MSSTGSSGQAIIALDGDPGVLYRRAVAAAELQRGTAGYAGGFVLAVLASAVCAACSRSDPEPAVYAAASLRVAMEEAVATFHGEHPTLDVRVVTAGSQILRRQIVAGAPASLFVPASFDHVQAHDVAELLEPPALLTCNGLVVVVTPDSPIHELGDLDRAERLVLGAPEVPVGAYAERALRAAGEHFGSAWHQRVLSNVVSREIDVRQVLAKVRLGEADAGVVYRTDARAAEGAVTVIPIPSAWNVEARYPLAVVREGVSLPHARRFAAWLRSEAGFAVLQQHGFEQCGETHEGHTGAP